jgi:hypothetical protein
MQVFCDWRLMSELATVFHEISQEMPVVVDHMLHIPAARGVDDANFQGTAQTCGRRVRACESLCALPDVRPVSGLSGRAAFFMMRYCMPILSG